MRSRKSGQLLCQLRYGDAQHRYRGRWWDGGWLVGLRGGDLVPGIRGIASPSHLRELPFHALLVLPLPVSFFIYTWEGCEQTTYASSISSTIPGLRFFSSSFRPFLLRAMRSCAPVYSAISRSLSVVTDKC